MVASSIGGAKDEVTVYDSLYKVVDKGTHDLLKQLLKNVKIKVFVLQPQSQAGVHDWCIHNGILYFTGHGTRFV